jgi:hypothetical protein
MKAHRKVVECCAFKKNVSSIKEGVTTERPLYICYTTDGLQFFTNEKLSAGSVVRLSEAEEGDTYLKNGVATPITPGRITFDGLIGTSNQFQGKIDEFVKNTKFMDEFE